jgi:hypothetical protein
MKISSEHYQVLETAINDILAVHNANGELVAAYEAGEFNKSESTKDLQKRFCFDVLYGTGLNSFVCKELYEYLDDTHIYTAIKSICPTVTRNY